jgi:predicted metal-dependent enzyme (double-stranded beta helix superfamily)
VNVNKIMYKPVGMLVGVLGGILATAVFNKVWGKVAGEDEAPDATDKNATWGQVLLAATIQGAIFGVVKAALDRGGAVGYRKVTGEWPGDDD